MEKETNGKITRQTVLPLGLVASIIGVIIVSIVWVFGIKSQTENCCKTAETNAQIIRDLPTKEMYGEMNKKLDLILDKIISK